MVKSCPLSEVHPQYRAIQGKRTVRTFVYKERRIVGRIEHAQNRKAKFLAGSGGTRQRFSYKRSVRDGSGRG